MCLLGQQLWASNKKDLRYAR